MLDHLVHHSSAAPVGESRAILGPLGDLARAASTAEGFGQLAGLVAQTACELVAADAAALYVFDDARGQLRLAYASEGAAHEVELAGPESLAGQVFDRGQAVLIEDYPTWRKAGRSFEPGGFSSAAAVALRGQTQPLGVLVVRFRAPIEHPDALDLLSVLSMVASAALETARLGEALQQQNQLQAAMRRITQALAAHENEGRVLWLAVRYAAQLLGASLSRLWILQEDGSFVCAAAEGYLEPDPIGTRLPPGSVAGVLVMGGPTNLVDAPAHPAWHASPTLTPDGVRAYVGAPLRRAGRHLGVLDAMRAAPFPSSSLHVITALADAAASAVDNARALARMEQLESAVVAARQRERVLFEHSPVAVVRLDTDGTIVETNPAWEMLNGNGRPLEGLAARVPVLAGGQALGAYEFLEDANQQRRIDGILNRGARQQSALADIATYALLGSSISDLLQTTADAVAGALDAQFGMFFELDAAEQALVLRAATPLARGLLGTLTVPLHDPAQTGRSLLEGDPLLIHDLRVDPRFEASGWPLLADGALSSVSVPVADHHEIFGVLVAHATHRRAFTAESAAFLKAMAHVAGLAIAYRRGQAALDRRTREFTTLVEHIPDMVLHVGPDLRITFVNSAVEWATGRPARGYVGARIEALGIPQHLTDLAQLRLEQVFQRGRGQRFELPLEGPSAEHVYEVVLTPELAPDGSVEHVLAVAHDITQRKQIEVRRAEEQQQLLVREQRLEQLLEQVLETQANEHRRRAEAAKLEPLSARELDVLRLLAQGFTNAQIARDLHVSPGTVKNHVGRILPKLGAVDRTQAAARAVDLGLVPR